MGIAQVVSIVILVIGAILIASSGEKPDEQGKPDPDDAPNPVVTSASDADCPNGGMQIEVYGKTNYVCAGKDGKIPSVILPGDDDNAKTPGTAKAGNWLVGIGGAALCVTTFMSMLTGITIGTRGNYGRK